MNIEKDELVLWSQEWLWAMKLDKDATHILVKLSKFPFDKLQRSLNTDEKKKAFWINIYNAGFLYLRKQLGYSRPDIFRKKLLSVAGKNFSLDDIEHGILRRYRWKWSMGYLPAFMTDRIIRTLAVKMIDPRIHFALNCGARACPPIAFYSAEKIASELELAARSFLEKDIHFEDIKKEVTISRLLLWYQGDFGGPKGIRVWIKKISGKDATGYKLRYRAYDWTEHLENFVP